MSAKHLFATSSALTVAACLGTAALLPVKETKAVPAAAADGNAIYLTGTIRDFIERTKANGHTDFERQPSAGFGLYCQNVSPTLGSNGKPMFVGGGRLVNTQWKDSQNRPICWNLFNAAAGDTAGSMGATSTGGITSMESFSEWFTDVPGKNLSSPLTLKFVKSEDGSYVFDDKLDPTYQNLGGFFPIDNLLFGNSGGSPKHNYHFTFELHTEFTYHAGTGQVFKFIGDDDVFVFINNKLVIDLGGVHSAKDQFVDLDRLGLTDGQNYPLDFFFAERHRTQSNFRIQTNLKLDTPLEPSVTWTYD